MRRGWPLTSVPRLTVAAGRKNDGVPGGDIPSGETDSDESVAEPQCTDGHVTGGAAHHSAAANVNAQVSDPVQ